MERSERSTGNITKTSRGAVHRILDAANIVVPVVGTGLLQYWGIVGPEPSHAFVTSALMGGGIQAVRSVIETRRDYAIGKNERRDLSNATNIVFRSAVWGALTGGLSALISLPGMNEFGLKLWDGTVKMFHDAKTLYHSIPKPTPHILISTQTPMPALTATPEVIGQVGAVPPESAFSLQLNTLMTKCLGPAFVATILALAAGSHLATHPNSPNPPRRR